jgi:hypothetical protein
MTTHHAECWRNPKHHGCAEAHIEHLILKLQQIKKHAAQGVTDPGFAKDQCQEILDATKSALQRVGAE